MKEQEILADKERKHKLGRRLRHGCAICRTYKKTTLHKLPKGEGYACTECWNDRNR